MIDKRKTIPQPSNHSSYLIDDMNDTILEHTEKNVNVVRIQNDHDDEEYDNNVDNQDNIEFIRTIVRKRSSLKLANYASKKRFDFNGHNNLGDTMDNNIFVLLLTPLISIKVKTMTQQHLIRSINVWQLSQSNRSATHHHEYLRHHDIFWFNLGQKRSLEAASNIKYLNLLQAKTSLSTSSEKDNFTRNIVVMDPSSNMIETVDEINESFKKDYDDQDAKNKDSINSYEKYSSISYASSNFIDRQVAMAALRPSCPSTDALRPNDDISADWLVKEATSGDDKDDKKSQITKTLDNFHDHRPNYTSNRLARNPTILASMYQTNNDFHNIVKSTTTKTNSNNSTDNNHNVDDYNLSNSSYCPTRCMIDPQQTLVDHISDVNLHIPSVSSSINVNHHYNHNHRIRSSCSSSSTSTSSLLSSSTNDSIVVEDLIAPHQNVLTAFIASFEAMINQMMCINTLESSDIEDIALQLLRLYASIGNLRLIGHAIQAPLINYFEGKAINSSIITFLTNIKDAFYSILLLRGEDVKSYYFCINGLDITYLVAAISDSMFVFVLQESNDYQSSSLMRPQSALDHDRN